MEKSYIIYYPRALVGNGGPTVAMWAWVKAIKAAGQQVSVICDKALIADQPLAIRDVPVIPVLHRLYGKFRYPANLNKLINENTILIIHSAFLAGNLVAAYIAIKKGARYILTPHGAYDRAARYRNSFLKKIWLLIESRFANKALAIHAFVDSEHSSILEVAPAARIITAPTGISIPHSAIWHGGGRYVAWFGRYDIEHKGLDFLIEAYRRIPANLRLPLLMRGRDSIKYTKEDVFNLVKQVGLESVINVGGPIEGEEKTSFLCNAELFVMPSRWESFSIALLEALALDAPCLVSQLMPIADDLRKWKAAIITEPQPDVLADTLTRIFEGEIELSTLKPRVFVQKNYSPEAVGKSFVAQVNKLIESGGYPYV